MKIWVILFFFSSLFLLQGTFGEQCGKQAGGALCPGGLCCSQHGWCGNTEPYCGDGCQSQCWGTPPAPPPPPPPPPSPPAPPAPPSGRDITELIPQSTFEDMLKYRNDPRCHAVGFYTYDAFITAARSFLGFANTGDDTTREREIAAFFGQTSHETTGGWPTADDGPYAWGYCYKREQNPPHNYCSSSSIYPCAPGKTYWGRGPMQLSWNFNYGQCGEALGIDLLNNPDLVEQDPLIAFKAAIWFWMTPQSPKPSCHDVIVGNWKPTQQDIDAGRVPGYGLITNIINGGLECGRGYDDRVNDRIGFYKRYCDKFNLAYDDNLDCYNQKPYGSGLAIDTM